MVRIQSCNWSLNYCGTSVVTLIFHAAELMNIQWWIHEFMKQESMEGRLVHNIIDTYYLTISSTISKLIVNEILYHVYQISTLYRMQNQRKYLGLCLPCQVFQSWWWLERIYDKDKLKGFLVFWLKLCLLVVLSS